MRHHLFYHLKQNGRYYIPAGIFDEVNPTFGHQIFIDRKLKYYAFVNKTKNMTEAEVLALFAQSAE